MQARRSSAASSCGAGELSAASTTRMFWPIAPSTVVSRSSTTLEKATCGLATSARCCGWVPANRRLRPSAWSVSEVAAER